jgi:hypothetical protein
VEHRITSAGPWGRRDVAESDVGRPRIIDWGRLGFFVFAYALCLLSLALPAPFLIIGVCAAIGTPLAVIWLIVHSIGTTMDLRSGCLSFPSVLWRRSVSLDQIHDANCQVVYRGGLASLNNVLDSSGSRRRPPAVRQYAVNLSGAFGSRQVRFASKKRRDQFLSLLRQFTHCRITRWS